MQSEAERNKIPLFISDDDRFSILGLGVGFHSLALFLELCVVQVCLLAAAALEFSL